MLTLTRVSAPRQTMGLMRHEESSFACCTLELPWQLNETRRSCIPPGPGESTTYKAKPHASPQFGDTLWVPGVRERSEILVHAGNYVSDTLGCILVGRRFTDIDGDGLFDVTYSQETLEQLLARVRSETELRIEWADPPSPAGLSDVAGLSVDEMVAEVSV